MHHRVLSILHVVLLAFLCRRLKTISDEEKGREQLAFGVHAK